MSVKMTTEKNGEFRLRLGGSGIATVDWGDGSEKVTLTLSEEGYPKGVEFKHTYPNATIRTITINGNTIVMLACGYITSLDVSKNTSLTELGCSGSFMSIDLSKNSVLTNLFIDGQLTSLDVSKNTALTELEVSAQLTSLDVSKNTSLISLNCANNQLTSLDLSKNTSLEQIACPRNQLTSLDFSKNIALRHFDCSDNKLDVSALKSLFESLHSNPPVLDYVKSYNIVGNPGATRIVLESIIEIVVDAERKGWKNQWNR